MAIRTLPVCLQLDERPCLVVGGGVVARRKTAWLLEAELTVEGEAKEYIDAFRKLEEHYPRRLKLSEQAYASRDLSGYQIVLAATDDRATNARVAEDARKSGARVNVADHPGESDFFIPATLQRGKLRIAISTDGAAPSLASRIRDELEERYPEHYRKLLPAIDRVRNWLHGACPDEDLRHRLMRILASRNVLDPLADLDRDGMVKALREKVVRLLNAETTADVPIPTFAPPSESSLPDDEL